jgi:hypothetical protein
VSTKWLQGYLNEFVWRYDDRPRVDGRSMFRVLIQRAPDLGKPEPDLGV